MTAILACRLAGASHDNSAVMSIVGVCVEQRQPLLVGCCLLVSAPLCLLQTLSRALWACFKTQMEYPMRQVHIRYTIYWTLSWSCLVDMQQAGELR